MKTTKTRPNLTSRESLDSFSKEELIDVVLQLGGKLQQLSDTVRDLIAAKYGRKTERVPDPGQLSIFAPESNIADSVQSQPQEEEEEEVVVVKDPPKQTRSTSKSRKPGHSRNQFPEHLPRKPVVADQPAAGPRMCECCNAELVVVREILQRSRLQFVPASFYVEDLFTQIFGCPNGHGSEVSVKVPEVAENSIAAAGLLAQVCVAKGTDHQPFNRQSAIYARSGVHLSRSTLCDLFALSAGILCPLVDYMHTGILNSKVICTDDTPVKVLDRKRSKNIKLGRLWIYLGDNDHPFNLFDYTTGRGREGPLAYLDGFGGFLQGDCFKGNLAVCARAGTTLVACMAHARRYFIKAFLNDKDGCNKALTMFQALYEVERTAKELGVSSPELKLMREQESVPMLEEMYEWLHQQYALALPQSSFAKALFYCLNNWNELTQYVVDGDLSIDNNVSEREMKYVAMGRKAWLFLGSDEGGKNHAIVLSLLSTCRRHGVEPWAYLTDVIQQLTQNPNTDLENLLPHKWKPKLVSSVPAEITTSLGPPKTSEISATSQNAVNLDLLQIAV